MSKKNYEQEKLHRYFHIFVLSIWGSTVQCKTKTCTTLTCWYCLRFAFLLCKRICIRKLISRIGSFQFQFDIEKNTINSNNEGGGVGFGDALENINVEVVKSTCRSDGRLLQISQPLIISPLQLNYMAKVTNFQGL